MRPARCRAPGAARVRAREPGSVRSGLGSPPRPAPPPPRSTAIGGKTVRAGEPRRLARAIAPPAAPSRPHRAPASRVAAHPPLPSPLAAAPAARAARAAVVVRASAEDRRAVLGALGAAAAALAAAPARAAVDLIDQRDARARGFDIIYDARDIDKPQAFRDGISEFRGDLAKTRARLAESERRLDVSVDGFVQKKYWSEATEELRRQMGTLNFDIDTLAAQLPKAQRAEVAALKAAFKQELTDLNTAIRKNDQPAAIRELGDAKAALDAVISKLG
jgi:photosystem II oxygen-evolving enhancer protein 3